MIRNVSFEHTTYQAPPARFEAGTASIADAVGLGAALAYVERVGLSFVLDGYQPEDVAAALNEYGIAVRAGHHCAQPILRRYGLTSSVRAALAIYNTRAEIDQLAATLRRIM